MGMTHTDVLVDADEKFVIDTVTRKITGGPGKTTLVKGDHNSERYGFSIPRYIDGHDMSLTDRITVGYSNGSTTGAYIVDDAATSTDEYGEETVEFSWVVLNNATQNIATLVFGITFQCFDTDGNTTYQWSTLPCSTFTVQDGMTDAEVEVISAVADNLARVLASLNLTDLSTDTTLTKSGKPADAKAVGDAISDVSVTLTATDDGEGNVTLSNSKSSS